MKKYFLLVTVVLFCLPLFNSCGSPSGQPKNDAESWRGPFKDYYELQIEYLEKRLEMAEYYAKKDDAKGYQEFLKELESNETEIINDFRKEHQDEYEDIQERIYDAKNEIRGKYRN